MSHPLLFSVLALLLLPACGDADAESAPAPLSASTPAAAPITEVRVELARLEASTAEIDIQVPAEVNGAREALLASATGGFVEKVYVREGETVKSGQALANIDQRSALARRDQAQAQAELAAAEVGRLETMGDLVSKQQLDQARTQLRLAESNHDLAKIAAERAVVRAPFAGVVSQVGLEQGEVVGPGTPVARLVEIDRVELSMSVADRDVVGLREGMPVSVRTDATSHTFTGTLMAVSPAADLQTRSFLVKALVDNPDRTLLPGMIARVSLHETLQENALLIPQDWLVTRMDGLGVFIAEGETARWRTVEPGRVVGDRVVITSGINPGDTLVITGHKDLMDGDTLLVARSGVCCTDGRVVF